MVIEKFLGVAAAIVISSTQKQNQARLHRYGRYIIDFSGYSRILQGKKLLDLVAENAVNPQGNARTLSLDLSKNAAQVVSLFGGRLEKDCK